DFLIKDIGGQVDLLSLRREFIQQFYTMRTKIPPVVTLDGEIENEELLTQWLSEKTATKVRLIHPQKGEQMHILAMAKQNAAERLAQSRGHLGHELTALDELAKLLGLSKVPVFIESYDISNLMGTENVAGMVVFKNGRPYKDSYRRFKIKGFVGQDDYASMNEVLTRRFEEYFKNKDSGEGFGILPDLILLDGGKGQVSAVRPVLERFGLNIPLFGMVKDGSHRTRAITDEGREIAITSRRQAFTLVSTIQDEVHRFAVGYHRAARKKKTFSSSLTNIDGIGKERAKALLSYFKTIDRIKTADVEELMNVREMNRPAAEAVYRYYHYEDGSVINRMNDEQN
ncbi:MAG: excinuclease ABC subunit UvrC, partial [Clostridia bacterium]|nr:excinuclease ABC subunit UvrC [Clostridia bacterium]